MRTLIAAFKITTFFILSLLTIPIQALGYVFLGKSRAFYLISSNYYRLVCLIFRIRIDLEGARATGQVVYVGNHLSYIDIPVVGAQLNATFISKADVKHWPIFGTLSRLARTIYIERKRDAVESSIKKIGQRLNEGRSLILFPEGTSSSGQQVLPFKSSLFELFLSDSLKNKLVIQPFTVSLLSTNQQTVETSADFDRYAWYADMEFMPHLWELAKTKGAYVSLTFHPPREAKDYDNRKQYALDCEQDVRLGLEKTLPIDLAIKDKAL